MIVFVQAAWLVLWLCAGIVVAHTVMPYAWAHVVFPADIAAAIHAHHYAATRGVIPIELVHALADRLAVKKQDGNLICPRCRTGDYRPVDTWTHLTVLYQRTGQLPDVVRAVCMDCGTATHATDELISHYFPAEHRTLTQEGPDTP